MAKYNNYSTEREYTKLYENLRGVDFTDVPGRKSSSRFGYLENMYVDYEAGGDAIESIPGFRKIGNYSNHVNGLFSQKLGDGEEFVIVHAGNKLFRFNSKNRDISVEWSKPIFTSLANSKSSAFNFGDSVYVMDGERIVVVDSKGGVSVLGDGSAPYVPTLSVNGSEFEAVNLLNSSCICRYVLENLNETSRSSKGLMYKITDSNAKTCSVTGISKDFAGELHIPSYIIIDGVKYKVTSISNNAFDGNKKITSLITNSNLEIIERYAFRNCTSLTTVRFSDTLSEIGHYSFYNCTALTTLYVGIGFSVFGVHSMDSCTGLTNVYYAGTAEEFETISRIDQVSVATVSYGVEEQGVSMSIPISKKMGEVTEVTLGGTQVNFSFDKPSSEVYIEIENKYTVTGNELIVYGNAERGAGGGEFFEATASLGISAEQAILGCRICAVYDGRIFLSGNPALPGYVFYSSMDKNGNIDPSYFAANDFFVEGDDNYAIISMLPSEDGLIIFKSGDGGEGSIFYHKPQRRVGEKTEYPSFASLKNVSVKGAAFDFYGDILFISNEGISAIEKSSGKLQVRCRSRKINPRLICESAQDIKLAEWRGYLVVSVGSRMYLGDSRAKFDSGDSFEYEWYYLNGIGSHKGGDRVFRYLDAFRDGYTVHEAIDQPTSFPIHSATTDYIDYYYFAYDKDSGKKYPVYPTEERTGGRFYEASAILTLGELLYFGTTSGEFCVFNNDKRGVAPPQIQNLSDFDEEEYKAKFKRRIHSDFYSFDNRPVRYVASTTLDDCGHPHLKKSSVRNSLVIKCKNFEESKIKVSVSTDTSAPKSLAEFSGSAFSFNDLNFLPFSPETSAYSIIALPEAERGWIEKRITVSSDSFGSPLGIYSIAYRYKIKGKIKKN